MRIIMVIIDCYYSWLKFISGQTLVIQTGVHL